MLTLYKACSGGLDWGGIYEGLNDVGWFYSMLFLLFMFFFEFALFNILTGIFVEKAMCAALPARDDLVWKRRMSAQAEKGEFKRVCKVFDPLSTGKITWE